MLATLLPYTQLAARTLLVILSCQVCLCGLLEPIELFDAAGILRYQVDFQTMELPDDIGNDFDLDDY